MEEDAECLSVERFVYCCVASDDVILADYLSDEASRSLETSAQKLLAKIDCKRRQKTSFSAGGGAARNYCFHVFVVDELAHVCLAHRSVLKSLAYALLEKLQKEFKSQFGDLHGMPLSSYAMSADFAPYMKRLLAFYCSDAGLDKLGKVQGTLLEVKKSVVKNIDKALSRGRDLEALCEKSEFLSATSKGFTMDSRVLHRDMWWSNVRNYIYIGSVLFGIFVLVGMYHCGITFYSCRASSSTPSL
eukprot:g2319.t1